MIPSIDIEVSALAERARDYGEPVEWIGTIMLKEVIGGPLVYLHGTREDFRKLAAALYALTGTGPDESDERRKQDIAREAIRDKNVGRGEIAASMTTLRPLMGIVNAGNDTGAMMGCTNPRIHEFGLRHGWGRHQTRGAELLDSAARSLVDGEPVLATAEESSEALELKP